ncbi:ankyrin repeat domain-containing protein [Singulisphaera acidiphila]|uniref:Ankyrin repeat-containing protein n=1 Tax=Singulisphaera acidiphila (strain ATCC BAA-1392 / DSM 18658 / VKM B-2454 / MOB10) TaxID=886293 RepID=L0DPT9_SINAD|nr:ankyrin repeat domain-containing protein [Singulisphaera acidiphila]AGA30701.1 ankyrin repeat-containing protein [Singulisphaera acidiphila DSM 18658]
MTSIDESVAAFIEAACVPLDSDHASGTLEEAQAILGSQPEVAGHNIYTAAVLGDDAAVRRLLAIDPANATAKGGPRDWDALTHLCFSRFLRLDPARSEGFVRAATALLDAGASPNNGWYEKSHQPKPLWESVLYGAAGIAHHEGLTRLLLERGADPNDDETPYHAPESYEMGVLKALVESGKLNDESLATILLRKADCHHFEAIKWLLEQGVDPNLMTRWGRTALHNALLSDNALEIIEVLLDHGADPTLQGDSGHGYRGPSQSSVALAAHRGRADVLDVLERRGIPIELHGVDRLIAACARSDTDEIRSLTSEEPSLVSELITAGGKLLAEFAGNGNTQGVQNLLDLGVVVSALHTQGDGYFEVAPNSTALHVAAWRARHDTVKLLITRGAPIDVPDGAGRTPLALAVKACVDSYWTHRRSPESVAALLRAGASVKGIAYPSGDPDVDSLLESHGAQSP